MAERTEPQAVKLSFGYKVTWGIAALGNSLISGIFAALLPIFYQDYLGLNARWIGLASLIYGIWNALNDPIFGFISDSTRSKHGRRIPYMRYTAPFLALSFILVWLAPQKATDFSLFLWMLITMILYDGCYTIIGLVYSALPNRTPNATTCRFHPHCLACWAPCWASSSQIFSAPKPECHPRFSRSRSLWWWWLSPLCF
jgi:Na+/melibiose symporter-like transporter